jgi:cell division protein FtsB
MLNFSKRTCLIILSLFLILSGIFIHRWWQTEGKLREQVKQAEQKESLIEELRKIHKNNFMYCENIKALSKEWEMKIYFESVRGDLVVIDPEGEMVSRYSPEGKGIEYQLYHKAGNGLPAVINIATAGGRKIGDYLIAIFNTETVSNQDTYVLALRVGDEEVFLAKNASFDKTFLNRLFILRSTETEIIPIVPASVGCRF